MTKKGEVANKECSCFLAFVSESDAVAALDKLQGATPYWAATLILAKYTFSRAPWEPTGFALGRPGPPWVPRAPWLSPGSPWPSLGAPGCHPKFCSSFG